MATSKKKTVTKDDLRKLMRERKIRNAIQGSDRINHPLAKYNSLDQLVCTLCNMVVKSSALWTAHLQGRQHKDKVEALKEATLAGPKAPTKRPGPDLTHHPPSKKSKDINGSSASGLPADFFDGKQTGTAASAGSGALAIGDYSSEDEDSEEEEEEDEGASEEALPGKAGEVSKSMPASGLPADFFDPGVKPMAEDSEANKKPKEMAEVLPEGFFDDPKMDAKVRKVEYKDKMEEEWEKFQRVMKEEHTVSEAIVEDDDEQINQERDIDEIDSQILRYKMVNDMQEEKEVISKTAKTDSQDNSSDEDLDEDELNVLLDWRSKKSWK